MSKIHIGLNVMELMMMVDYLFTIVMHLFKMVLLQML